MDLSSPKYLQAPSLSSNGGSKLDFEGNTSFFRKNKENPFADSFTDPVCKLNLKETSEFVKSLPMADQKRVEVPSTPGRPVFSFSGANLARKNFPSKWDDAEKWLISSSCIDSPAHPFKSTESSNFSKQCENVKQQMAAISEKYSGAKGSLLSEVHNSARTINRVSDSTDTLLKDKFTDNVQPIVPNFRYSEPSKEGFLFRNSGGGTMKNAGSEVVHEVQHRDVGTEMTPLGSSKTSRCHTPLKTLSPARHNTPENRSGPLAMGNFNRVEETINISQLEECHLAKLQLGTQYDSVVSNWSSREEEEEEVSKSLRHFEMDNDYRRSVSQSRTPTWEEEEETKICLRYQREEARIQAWLNLQNAKAEAQSRKLEVKIQKKRSKLEEKLMKRMAVVHRKVEEWRALARQQHSEQMHRGKEQVSKMMENHNKSHFSGHNACGCFPCNSVR